MQPNDNRRLAECKHSLFATVGLIPKLSAQLTMGNKPMRYLQVTTAANQRRAHRISPAENHDCETRYTHFNMDAPMEEVSAGLLPLQTGVKKKVGVLYLASIPPRMTVTKLREYFNMYSGGKVGRMFLQERK